MINENNNKITEKDLGEIDWDLALYAGDLTAEEVFTDYLVKKKPLALLLLALLLMKRI